MYSDKLTTDTVQHYIYGGVPQAFESNPTAIKLCRWHAFWRVYCVHHKTQYILSV